MASATLETLSNLEAEVAEVGKRIEQLAMEAKKGHSKPLEENIKEKATIKNEKKDTLELKSEENSKHKKINDQFIHDNKNDMNPKTSFEPFVVVGPSGVGKGTLLEYLPKRFENTFVRAISHTTRAKRENEKHGVHYYFVSKQDFETKIRQNYFLEYANVHGNLYGTSYQSIKDVENKKQICILEKDFQGAMAIRNINMKAKYMFITCNGQIDTLRQRLKGRQTENEEQIKHRLKTAEIEFEFLNKDPSFFDYVLSNDHLSQAQSELVDILKKWYPGIQDLWYIPTVVVGPSGVGKGTLLQHIKQRFPNIFGVSVSHTTRPPRSNVYEKHGVHYYFVTKEEFEKDIKNDKFIEYACVHGNYYGTSKKAIRDVASKQEICLLEIDYQGAISVKKSSMKARYLFVTCSGGLTTLKSRLLDRNTEDGEKIKKRLETAETELEFLKNNPEFFDLVLQNDDLHTALDTLSKQLKIWYPWTQDKEIISK